MKDNLFKKIAIGVVAILLVVLLVFFINNSKTNKEASDLGENKDVNKPVEGNKNDKEIVIISINDFHGNLAEDAREGGKNLGMSKLVAAVNNYKKSNANTVVVSAGDNYQGSAMSNLTYGAPVSEMFKQLDLFVSAVGNHEFDWGINRTEQWAKDGDFTFLAANIVDKTTQEPVKWAKPYEVKEINGVKIGFVGLTTIETAYKTVKERIKNYEFLPVKETAEKWAKYLRSGDAPEGKVDVVIALCHVGSGQDYETKEISGEVIDQELYKAEGIDAILSGHSHQRVAGIVDGMPIVQGYKYGRAIAKLTLKLDDNKKVVEIVPEIDNLYKNKSQLIADPTATTIYDKYKEELSPIMDEKLGKTEIELTHDRSAEGTSVLGYVVCDVIRKNVDAQIGIMNSGGIRCPIAKGDVTMGNLYEVLPFDNTVVKLELTGEQLKKIINNGIDNESIGWVEVAGLKVNYDINREFGDRVIDMYLEDGTKIESDKIYTVAANDFIVGGGDNYDFSQAKSKDDTFVPVRDVIVNYLKEGNVINFEFVQPLVQVESKDTANCKNIVEYLVARFNNVNKAA